MHKVLNSIQYKNQGTAMEREGESLSSTYPEKTLEQSNGCSDGALEEPYVFSCKREKEHFFLEVGRNEVVRVD